MFCTKQCKAAVKHFLTFFGKPHQGNMWRKITCCKASICFMWGGGGGQWQGRCETIFEQMQIIWDFSSWVMKAYNHAWKITSKVKAECSIESPFPFGSPQSASVWNKLLISRILIWWRVLSHQTKWPDRQAFPFSPRQMFLQWLSLQPWEKLSNASFIFTFCKNNFVHVCYSVAMIDTFPSTVTDSWIFLWCFWSAWDFQQSNHLKS